MKTVIMALLVLSFQIVAAQTFEEYYQNDDFQSAISFEKDTHSLTGEQLLKLGYAFFRLENDAKALSMYDKALAKGTTKEGAVHFFRGLSLRNLDKAEEALEAFAKALKLEPDNQEYASEIGLTYYFKEDWDKALEAYKEAQKMPNIYHTPYYIVGHIYHIKQEFDTALQEFYKGLDSLTADQELYVQALMDIGLLEYTHTRNFKKSAEAYAQIMALQPDNYAVYPKLMKAYNAVEDYEKADQVFDLMKTAYHKKELPEDYMKFKSAAIDEFYWNEQRITIYRFFDEPKEPLDLYYKIYLLNKEGDKVERTFMTEKTMDFGIVPDNPKHLFCEKEKNGAHYTYPYGWIEDKIALKALKNVLILALEGKIKPSASSSFKKD